MNRLRLGLLAIAIACGLTACLRGSDPANGLDRMRQPATPIAGPALPLPLVKPAAPETAEPAPGGSTLGNGWYRARTEWAASRIDVSNIDPMQRIWRITVHHSGDANDALGDPERHLREFERAHQGKGWACIGYHFIISRDGTVFEGRPLTYQGAHATGDNNIGNVGICLLGNFDNRAIPGAQRRSLEDTIARLRKAYRIRKTDIYGHRDFKTTDCPGRYVMDWLEAYKAD